MLTYIPVSFLFSFIFRVTRVRVKNRDRVRVSFRVREVGFGLGFGFRIGNLIGGAAGTVDRCALKTPVYSLTLHGFKATDWVMRIWIEIFAQTICKILSK